MSQILRNQRSGQVGPKDPMHRTLPDSQRFLDPMTGMWSDPAGLPYIPRANGGPMHLKTHFTDPNEYNEAARQMTDPTRFENSAGAQNNPFIKRRTAIFLDGGKAPAQRGGGGGGGGGRMGPQNEKPIMNVGPRTASDYVAKHGGLSPQRPSALDAQYAMGNLTDPRAAEWLNNQPPAAAPGGLTPTQMVADAGASVGGAFGGMLNDAMPDSKSMGRLAKGGSMHPGKKPYLVGEEGPELILPREDGSGFVLPADVTAQVLPAMRDVTPKAKGGKMGYTPRAEGGEIMLERQGDLGTMRGFLTPSGSGFAEVQNEVGAEPIMPIDKFFADPSSNYQLDPTRPGMPLMPDAVSGPWAEPAMPVTPEMRQDLRSNTLGNFMALAAMPDTQRVVDPRQAMRERGIEAMANLDNIRYEQEQARVQRDLAARAARAPLGTPTAPAAPAMDRNMERFMRTPEGMRLAMQQQMQERQLLATQQAANQWQPMIDPGTGRPFAMVNGRGQQLSLPQMEDDETVIYVDKQVQDPSGLGVVTIREPQIFSRSTGTMRPIQAQPGGTTAGAVTGTGTSTGTNTTAAAAPKAITSKSEYDALPVGATYTWQGQTLTKKA